MTTTAAGSQTGSTRLHGLDALRAGALGLGIVLHALMPFLPGGAWLVVDTRTSDAVGPVVSWIHLFRMVTFMLLAGFFGRMVLCRRGAAAYLKDRALRILLPLLAFIPLVMGSFIAVGEVTKAVRETPPPPAPPAPPGVPEWLLLASPGHLWFLNVLMQCVVATLLVRVVLIPLLGTERLDDWAQRAGNALAMPAGVLLAAVPYVVCLLLQGDAIGGIREPFTLLPTLSSFVGYFGAFLVGWCLHARKDALSRLARGWPMYLGLALVLTVARSFVQEGGVPVVLHATLIALAGWTWTFALVGLCTRFLRRERPVVRYLADSSYWVYLLHLPLLVLIEVFLADLAWPVLVKLLITLAVAMVLLLLSYDLLVRRSWLGKWLNGRRRTPILLPAPRERTAPTPSTPPTARQNSPG